PITSGKRVINLPSAAGSDKPKNRFRAPFEWFRQMDDAEKLREQRKVTLFYDGVCVIWVHEDIDKTNSVRGLKLLKEEVEKSLIIPDLPVLGTSTVGLLGSSFGEGPYMAASALIARVPVCEFAITGRITSAKLRGIFKDDERLTAEEC